MAWAPHLTEDLHLLLRLFVAMVLTGALGWERNRSGKSAGIRTHMIVGMGACLVMILPELAIEYFRQFGESVKFDPLRPIQGVIAGISFVGAGTIFVSRDKDHVKGLTTAASLWTCTAVGMCVGVARYLLAAGATALLLLILHVIRKIEPEKDEGRRFESETGDQPNTAGQESRNGQSVGQSARRRSNPGA